MAQLYTLLFGKSKKKMRPIMIDTKAKCEQYMKARTANNGEKGCGGWHKIEIASADSNTWRQKSASVGDKRTGGYISKRGFNHHT